MGWVRIQGTRHGMMLRLLMTDGYIGKFFISVDGRLGRDVDRRPGNGDK